MCFARRAVQSVCLLLCVVTVSQGQEVYLSLGSNNITTNNTEVLITDIGQDASGRSPSLTCHTDLTECCRNSDTGGQGGRGEWYYPDGRVVPNSAAGEGFYRVRNAPQVVRLARRDASIPAIYGPSGTYCCVIPTTGGEMTFCANITSFEPTCSDLTLNNAMISYNRGSTDNRPVVTTATYSCDSGYTFNGESTRTCQIDGTWSGSAPTCTIVSCGSPPSIGNGSVNSSTGTTFGERTTYSCDIGYTLSGSAIITCQVNGSWETPPVCLPKVVDCFNLTQISSGMISYSGSGESTENRPIGTVTTYSCDTGYTLNGDRIRTCQSDGTWSGSAPTCKISCGSPPSISNGSPGTPTSTMVGGTVTYSCDAGYIMSDSANNLVTCLSTGNWSAPPSCQITPPVYLSLSSTNYLSGLPEIPLSSVGEGRGSSLVCHTDSPTCCRQLDSGMEGGVGEWYYPNGSVISADSTREGLYVTREQMSVSLNHRSGSEQTVTAGLYCCGLPTSEGTLYSCIVLDSQQEVSSCNCPQCTCENTGPVVGGVVAMVAVLVITVGVVIIVCLILKHTRQKRQGTVSVSNDPTFSGKGQSSATTYETVPGTYEEIPTTSSREVKGHYQYTQNEAYATTTMSERGHGN